MRECPICGYLDHPYWRHKAWRLHIDYCRLDEFEEINPELAKKLIDGHHVVMDKTNAYRRTGRFPKRGFYVERVWKSLYLDMGVSAFRSFKEKHHASDPYQKTMSDF